MISNKNLWRTVSPEADRGRGHAVATDVPADEAEAGRHLPAGATRQEPAGPQRPDSGHHPHCQRWVWHGGWGRVGLLWSAGLFAVGSVLTIFGCDLPVVLGYYLREFFFLFKVSPA